MIVLIVCFLHSDDSGRNAANNCIFWHILHNNCIRAGNTVFMHRNVAEYLGSAVNPTIVLDGGMAFPFITNRYLLIDPAVFTDSLRINHRSKAMLDKQTSSNIYVAIFRVGSLCHNNAVIEYAMPDRSV